MSLGSLLRLIGLSSIVAFVAFVASCATPQLAPLPYSVSTSALPLGSEPMSDAFDCGAGNCIHWYKVNARDRGMLFLVVELVDLPAEAEAEPGLMDRVTDLINSFGEDEEPGLPIFQITVNDARGERVADAQSEANRERPLQLPISRGNYFVSVHSVDADGRFGYRIRARTRYVARPKSRPAVPKPKEPTFETRPAVILEVVGWGADVEAVLIDLGSQHGMVRGLRGNIIDEGEIVGEVVIDTVFEEGSHASIEQQVERPLGPSASVEILVPVQ